MFKRLLSLFKSIPEPETPPSPDGFEDIEAKLKGMRAHPRPAFKQALQSKLRARYEEIHEDRLVKLLAAFRIPKWATATAVIVLVVGGSTLVGASPAPKPEGKLFGNMEDGQQPDFAPITLTFDQPMMMGSVEDAFQIEPAVEGHFVWNGYKEVLFIPSEPLDPDVTYNIKLTQEAKSLFQKNIDEPFEQTLTVQHIEIGTEDDPQVGLISEIRQIDDRPLTPQEKKFLHQKFNQMEQEVDFQALIDAKKAEEEEGGDGEDEENPFGEDRPLLEDDMPFTPFRGGGDKPPLWWILQNGGELPGTKSSEESNDEDGAEDEETTTSDWGMTSTTTVPLE
jgi:hypothetical protein